MDSEKIIKQYCGNIKERLLVCRSKSVAMVLKERLCTELQFNCVSEMVNNVLSEHVDSIINEIFDENGKNKLLENTNETN